MPTLILHPKRDKRCAFCKRWNGDAELVLKTPNTGYQVKTGVSAKCLKKNTSRYSTDGNACADFDPSVEASKLL